MEITVTDTWWLKIWPWSSEFSEGVDWKVKVDVEEDYVYGIWSLVKVLMKKLEVDSSLLQFRFPLFLLLFCFCYAVSANFRDLVTVRVVLGRLRVNGVWRW